MTPEKISKAVDACRTPIYRYMPSLTAARAPDANGIAARLGHLLWMADQIDVFLEEKRIEKAFRWLGFLQGALWVMALKTIEEAKHDNAPEGTTIDPDRV